MLYLLSSFFPPTSIESSPPQPSEASPLALSANDNLNELVLVAGDVSFFPERIPKEESLEGDWLFGDLSGGARSPSPASFSYDRQMLTDEHKGVNAL